MFPNSYLLDQSSSKPLESAPISKSSEAETGPSTPPTSRAGSAAEVIGQQPVVALIDAVEEPIETVEDHEDGDFIGQAHDMFSRIFQIRIYKKNSTKYHMYNICLYFLK